MVKKSDGSRGETVTYGNGFTAEELASLKLPGYPTSRKGWYERARRENWEIREEPGKGPGGVRQLFVPPAKVRELIDTAMHERPDGAAAPRSLGQDEAPYMVSRPFPAAAGIDAYTLAPDKEWLVRVTMLATDAEWMKGIDQERKVRIILDTFRITLMLAGGNPARFTGITSKPDAILSALRLAYEMDCLRSEST